MDMNLVYCPKCGARIDATGDLFVEHPQFDTIEVRVMGKCRECTHPYTWTQFYALVREVELEDDSDEGDEQSPSRRYGS